MSCATTIYVNLDNVMLGFITSDIDVGFYNAAVKIRTILLSIVTSLGTVLLPRSSYYVENNLLNEFKKITQKALSFVFLLAAPLTCYFILFAKEGIFFLSGNQYAGSVIPMQIIMPTVLIVGISNITGIQILVPLGKEKIVLYSEIVGAVIDVAVNAALIPRYASIGAAIGTLVAEIFVLAIQIIALKPDVRYLFRQIHYFRILVALFLGAIASLWLKTLELGNFVTLFSSAILFFGIYGLFLLFRKEEMITEIWNTVILNFLKFSHSKK